MGQIANQMVLELLVKMKYSLDERKEKWRTKRKTEKGECHAKDSSHRTEHERNPN